MWILIVILLTNGTHNIVFQSFKDYQACKTSASWINAKVFSPIATLVDTQCIYDPDPRQK